MCQLFAPAIGGFTAYFSLQANALIKAFRAGDMAEALRLQRIIQAGVDLLLAPDRFGGAGVNIGKALMVSRT